MIYVEVDFLLALIKDDDWLGERATAIYDERREELWTSHYALVELLLVAYREERNAERVVVNASRLVEVRGDVETVLAAASHIEEHGLTPLDALHLVRSGDDPIVSSDSSYDPFSRRIALETDEGP